MLCKPQRHIRGSLWGSGVVDRVEIRRPFFSNVPFCILIPIYFVGQIPGYLEKRPLDHIFDTTEPIWNTADLPEEVYRGQFSGFLDQLESGLLPVALCSNILCLYAMSATAWRQYASSILALDSAVRAPSMRVQFMRSTVPFSSGLYRMVCVVHGPNRILASFLPFPSIPWSCKNV